MNRFPSIKEEVWQYSERETVGREFETELYFRFQAENYDWWFFAIALNLRHLDEWRSFSLRELTVTNVLPTETREEKDCWMRYAPEKYVSVWVTHSWYVGDGNMVCGWRRRGVWVTETWCVVDGDVVCGWRSQGDMVIFHVWVYTVAYGYVCVFLRGYLFIFLLVRDIVYVCMEYLHICTYFPEI